MGCPLSGLSGGENRWAGLPCGIGSDEQIFGAE